MLPRFFFVHRVEMICMFVPDSHCALKDEVVCGNLGVITWRTGCDAKQRLGPRSRGTKVHVACASALSNDLHL